MELARYKACICEGSAENAIIDILLDYELLIFTREEMLEEEVIRCREGKKFEEKYLRKGFMEKISVYIVPDTVGEHAAWAVVQRSQMQTVVWAAASARQSVNSTLFICTGITRSAL